MFLLVTLYRPSIPENYSDIAFAQDSQAVNLNRFCLAQKIFLIFDTLLILGLLSSGAALLATNGMLQHYIPCLCIGAVSLVLDSIAGQKVNKRKRQADEQSLIILKNRNSKPNTDNIQDKLGGIKVYQMLIQNSYKNDEQIIKILLAMINELSADLEPEEAYKIYIYMAETYAQHKSMEAQQEALTRATEALAKAKCSSEEKEGANRKIAALSDAYS